MIVEQTGNFVAGLTGDPAGLSRSGCPAGLRNALRDHNEAQPTADQADVGAVRPGSGTAAPSGGGKTRVCGNCKLCCYIFALDGEFFEALHGPGGKPKRTWCKHAKGKGCALHDQPRPKVCTSFLCDWMRCPEVIPDAWRPDRSGVLLVTRWATTSQGVTIPVVQVSEHYAGLIDKTRITDRTSAVCIVNCAHERQPRIRNVRYVDGMPDPVIAEVLARELCGGDADKVVLVPMPG